MTLHLLPTPCQLLYSPSSSCPYVNKPQNACCLCKLFLTFKSIENLHFWRGKQEVHWKEKCTVHISLPEPCTPEHNWEWCGKHPPNRTCILLDINQARFPSDCRIKQHMYSVLVIATTLQANAWATAQANWHEQQLGWPTLPHFLGTPTLDIIFFILQVPILTFHFSCTFH